MGNEEKDLAGSEGAGGESERILEDTYLTGAVGMATTPRVSASTLHEDEGDVLSFRDESWRSGALEEGEPGEAPPKPKGFGARLRSWFGG